jgi:hypothetical protein
MKRSLLSQAPDLQLLRGSRSSRAPRASAQAVALALGGTEERGKGKRRKGEEDGDFQPDTATNVTVTTPPTAATLTLETEKLDASEKKSPESSPAREQGSALLDRLDDLDLEGEAVASETKRAKKQESHWCSKFLVEVRFVLAKLSAKAQSSVRLMDEYPATMLQCTLGVSHYTGTGHHQQFLLLNPNRPYNTNVVDHFNCHSKIKKYMEDAVARGEDLDRAHDACLKRFSSTSVAGGQQILPFARKNALEKNAVGLLDRERKELALSVWLLDSHTPLHRLRKQSWMTYCEEMGHQVVKPELLRRVHYPKIFSAILALRKQLFENGGFIHIEYDFLSNGSTKYLIVCGRTVVSFELFNDICGVVEWEGAQSSEHVAQLVSDTVERVASNAVLLASSTVDGALLAANAELVDTEDSHWCFCHQLALPIKKSLDGSSVMALDFAFMHSLGVFLRSHSACQDHLKAHSATES